MLTNAAVECSRTIKNAERGADVSLARDAEVRLAGLQGFHRTSHGDDPASAVAAPNQYVQPAHQLSIVNAVPGKDGVKRMVILRGLDKITARASIIYAPVDVPVKYATLTITARYCYSTPISETPETTAFLQILDHRPDQPEKKIFSGWMLASSPSRRQGSCLECLSIQGHPRFKCRPIPACRTLSVNPWALRWQPRIQCQVVCHRPHMPCNRTGFDDPLDYDRRDRAGDRVSRFVVMAVAGARCQNGDTALGGRPVDASSLGRRRYGVLRQ